MRWSAASKRADAATIQSRRAQGLEGFRRYAEQVVAPALGASGKGVELEAARRGLGSLIYFLALEGEVPLVLRVERRRGALRRRLHGHRVLLDRGLPAPEIRHCDLRPATRLRFGGYFSVETRMGGVHLDEHPRPLHAASLAGRTFARVHGAALTGPGLTSRPRSSVADRFRLGRSARKWLARLGPEDAATRNRVRRWLEQVPPAAWRPPLRLTFGDVAPNNVLVDDQGASLVDLSGVARGVAVLELVRSREKLLDGEAAFGAFLGAYLEEADPEHRTEVLRSFPLAETLRSVRALGRDGATTREDAMARLERALHQDPRAPAERKALVADG